jgi:hypothetical protein
MKPLIYLFLASLVLCATNIFAAGSSDDPATCEQNIHRKYYVKVNYQNPVIYCKYLTDDCGNEYRVCSNCDRNKCIKEYFFDNYCQHS